MTHWLAQPQRPPPGLHTSALSRAPAGRIGAMLLCALWSLIALPPPIAGAQTVFERRVLYTRAAPTCTLRAVTITYALTPVPTLTTGAPTDVGSPPLAAGGGADGLCIAPDGDVLVAGGALSPNAVHKVRPGSGVTSTASPGAGSPIAMQLAVDPVVADRVWAVCTGAGGVGRIARVPLAPFGQGVAFTISGPDTTIAHLCFAHGRAYYVSTGAAPGTGSLGVIDLNTFATTRLLTGLDLPRTLTLDPFTGHLIVFGASTILQVDARSGLAPTIISVADLSTLVPGLDLRSGTVDGLGHAIALSATGHIVLIDYSATMQVGHTANVRLAAPIEAPSTLASIVPLVGPGSLRDSGCLWDNGEFDQRDGLPSHNSQWAGDTRTADDFYLCSGVNRIDSIVATMFSDSLFLSALIEVYDDCDGRPGTLLHSFTAAVTDTGSLFQGLRVLSLVAPTPGLWLRGGRSYWVSAVGIGSLDGSDNWYWGTSGAPPATPPPPPGTPPIIRGKPAVFRAPSLGVPDWTASAQAGCGCTDFAFAVRGESCKTLHDNGPAQPQGDPAPTGAPSIISTTNSDSRAADNFRVPPCAENGGERVCFIEATVYTNCSPVRGLVEVFQNDCSLPTMPPLFASPFSKVIDLGYNVTIAGVSLRAYSVQVHDPGWFLPTGRNYWLSVAVQGSGGFSQRAYFAANSPPCDTPLCGIRISQSAIRESASPNWVPIENLLQMPRDLSFLVAVTEPQIGTAGSSGPTPGVQCLGDAEADGDVDVADIFSFLSSWFQGCP